MITLKTQGRRLSVLYVQLPIFHSCSHQPAVGVNPVTCYCQVLHMIRSHSQAEFEDIAEEAQLLSKLSDLEQLCEEQGIAADGTQQPR